MQNTCLYKASEIVLFIDKLISLTENSLV